MIITVLNFSRTQVLSLPTLVWYFCDLNGAALADEDKTNTNVGVVVDV